jgi:hypothetical protein
MDLAATADLSVFSMAFAIDHRPSQLPADHAVQDECRSDELDDQICADVSGLNLLHQTHERDYARPRYDKPNADREIGLEHYGRTDQCQEQQR